MEMNDYLSKLDKDIVWFSTKSRKNKRGYLRTKIMLTIIAAIVPAMTAYIDTNEIVKIIVVVLSVVTAILVNVTGIYQFKDNWTHYRNMCELLKSEKNLYIHSAGKYKANADKNALFVETIEDYLRNENKQWLDNLSSEKSKTK